MATKELRITNLKTREVVKTIDVTGKGEIAIERIIGGLLINMHEDYFVDEVEDEGSSEPAQRA